MVETIGSASRRACSGAAGRARRGSSPTTRRARSGRRRRRKFRAPFTNLVGCLSFREGSLLFFSWGRLIKTSVHRIVFIRVSVAIHQEAATTHQPVLIPPRPGYTASPPQPQPATTTTTTATPAAVVIAPQPGTTTTTTTTTTSVVTCVRDPGTPCLNGVNQTCVSLVSQVVGVYQTCVFFVSRSPPDLRSLRWCPCSRSPPDIIPCL